MTEPEIAKHDDRVYTNDLDEAAESNLIAVHRPVAIRKTAAE